MNNPADTLATLAADIERAGQTAPFILDNTAFAISPSEIDEWVSRLRVLASLKGEAAVPALEVFRIAGGDVECCPNPTAAEAMDCLRDLRQCYEESLTTPPAPQAVGEVKCPHCGSSKVAPTEGNGVGNTHDCLACLTDFTPSPAPQVASYEDFVRLATDPNRKPAPQGGGEAPGTSEWMAEVLRGAASHIEVRGQKQYVEHLRAIASYVERATPPAQQPGEVGDGRLAEAIWLLHEVCKGLHGVGCGPCIGSHAPMENLHGLIARYLGRRPDKHCRHCDGSGTADMGGECPCVTYALAPKEKGNG